VTKRHALTDWWIRSTYQKKGFILGVVASIIGDISVFTWGSPFAVLLLPFYVLIVLIYILYELIFGFQGEFGAMRNAMVLSLVIYPLIGYLIGLCIEKIKMRKAYAKIQ
jgi:cell division protein FtsX